MLLEEDPRERSYSTGQSKNGVALRTEVLTPVEVLKVRLFRKPHTTWKDEWEDEGVYVSTCRYLARGIGDESICSWATVE